MKVDSVVKFEREGSTADINGRFHIENIANGKDPVVFKVTYNKKSLQWELRLHGGGREFPFQPPPQVFQLVFCIALLQNLYLAGIGV